VEKLLIQLGFHKNEIAVYLALFELGKVRAKEIIAYTKLHRNLVYTALDALVARELVTKTIVTGVAEFVANNPQSLIDEVEEKKRIATTVAEELEKKQLETPREVSVHEGVQALQHMREKLLDDADGEDVYIFGASPQTTTPEWEHFWQGYHRRRVKREIPLKILYTKDSTADLLDWRNILPNTEAKYLPFDAEFPAWFGGAGDHFQVSIPGDNPLTFYIKSREAVLGFRAFFDYFWHQKASSETGYESVFRAWDYMLDSLEPGETYAVLGANFGWLNRQHNEYLEKFHLRRIQKGVVVNMITSKDSLVPIRDRFIRAGDPDLRLSTIKPFPSDVEQPFQINIFKGKTYIFIFSDEPTVIKFNDPEMALGFQSYFDTLWNQESYVLTGPEAIRDLWIESLEVGELNFIAARGYFVDKYPKLFKEVTTKAIQTPGLKWRIINDPSTKGHPLTQLPWVENRYVLPDVPNPNVVWIFGDKVAIANWTEDNPVVFVSTNQNLVQSYRDYFEAMWQQPELI
jgi:sugar-specific transcriptional regulator TrmB